MGWFCAVMFGTFRFLLALLVLSAHSGGFGAHGSMAVQSFFVVSGFLMTLVLNRTYRFDIGKFWINRFLRLYPPYYFVSALTIVCLLAWPVQTAAYHGAYRVSSRPIDWIGNLTMFPFPFYDASFFLVPPAWSVGTEIVMYLALFIFIARRPAFACLSLVAGMIYLVLAHWPNKHLDKIGSIPAALLPFSLGAIIYFAGDRFKLPAAGYRLALPGVALIWTLNLWATAVGADPDFTLYLNLALSIPMVGWLAHFEIGSALVRTTDKFLGDLSYPIFLVHSLAGFLVSRWGGVDHAQGFKMLVSTFLISMVISIGMVWYIDRPLQKIRRKVRPAN